MRPSSAERAAISHPTARVAAAPSLLCEFEAKMAILHDAGRCEQADAARDEDRFGIAVAEGLKLAQPTRKHRGDLMERQLGVDLEHALRFALGEALGSALGRGGA